MSERAGVDTPFFVYVVQMIGLLTILALGYRLERERLIMAETQEELAQKVRELQKEVERLNAQLKDKRFGLTWIDVPEAFEQESENRSPFWRKCLSWPSTTMMASLHIY